MRRFIASLAFLLVVACGQGPTKPIIPTPTPTPQATPTPPPPMRLLTEADLTNELSCAVTCCADEDESNGDEGLLTGWPFVDLPTLNLYAEKGIRATEVRPGPFGNIPEEEAIARTVEVLNLASARGIYVFVGLVDSWALAHPDIPEGNAYGDTCSVTRQNHLPARYVDWITKVVTATKDFPNVVYFDGNESFRCNPSRGWTNGIYAAARAAGARSLIGSNSNQLSLDFPVQHGFRTVPSGSILLESDNREHSKNDWSNLRRASGGTICYWRGPMSMPEWIDLLDE